jgi:hypothetical protein
MWLEALRKTGKAEVYVWRPSDWKEIEEKLARPGSLPPLEKAGN